MPSIFNLFCSSSDKSVRIWSMAASSLTPLQQLLGHQGVVSALAWSDFDVLASGSADMTVRLWSSTSTADSWKCLRILKGHMDAVSCVAWSPGSLLLATASKDKSIRVHNVNSSEKLQLMKNAAQS
jgi:WD40 repeat protein